MTRGGQSGQVPRLGSLADHVQLVRRMGKATRADLAAAAETGDLSPPDWAEMVQTCRRCGWAGGCAEWLAAHPDAASAPEPCLNRARLAVLSVTALLQDEMA